MRAKLTFLFNALALAPSSTIRTEKSAMFSSCLLQGPSNSTVVMPSSTAYNSAARATFNERLSYQPAAVAYPGTSQDVQRYVKCAARYGIAVVARSGGHSYASYGTGGQDGSLVIDMSNMASVLVDDSGVAHVQTGNRLGDVAQKIWDQGQRALPHGVCPYVGSGGHISFGGMGPYSRVAGLAQDRVVAAEVVLANGTLITTSATNHPDLFWAIRGAGPSFGIVTQWMLATLPAPPIVIAYRVSYDSSLSTAQMRELVERWQSLVPSAPDEIWFSFRVSRDASISTNPTLEFHGTYYGTQDAFNALTANWSNIFTPGNFTSESYNWYGGLVALSGPLSTAQPPLHRNFFAKSLFSSSALESSNWGSVFDYLGSEGMSAPVSWWLESTSYGGAISRQGPDATSFAHRDALFSYQLYGYAPLNTTYPSDGIPFVNNMLRALEPSPRAAYINYVDPTLTPDEWKSQYYGNHYPRLVSIKRAVDPNNVFRFPQSIELE